MNVGQVYATYISKFRYDYESEEKWHLRSLSEMERERICNCHDAGHYFEMMLHQCSEVDEVKLIYMELTSKSKPDANGSHTLTTYRCGDLWYLIEGTWFMMGGIHGPFRCFDELLVRMINMYRFIYAHDGAPDDLEYDLFEQNDVAEGTSFIDFDRLAKGHHLIPYDWSSMMLEVNRFDDDLVVIYMNNHTHDAIRNSESMRLILNEEHVSNGVYVGDPSDFKRIFESIFGHKSVIVVGYRDGVDIARNAVRDIRDAQVIGIDAGDDRRVNDEVVTFYVDSVDGYDEASMTVIDDRYQLRYADKRGNHRYLKGFRVLYETFIHVENELDTHDSIDSVNCKFNHEHI